jgi:hypothetical protein
MWNAHSTWYSQTTTILFVGTLCLCSLVVPSPQRPVTVCCTTFSACSPTANPSLCCNQCFATEGAESQKGGDGSQAGGVAMTPVGAPRAKQLSNAATICGEHCCVCVCVGVWGLYAVVGCSGGWPSYAPIVFLLAIRAAS